MDLHITLRVHVPKQASYKDSCKGTMRVPIFSGLYSGLGYNLALQYLYRDYFKAEVYIYYLGT